MSSRSQCACSSSNAAFVWASVANADSSAWARDFSTTWPSAMPEASSAGAHLASRGFSMYPRTNVKLRDSPGARSTARWCEPIGYQPEAMEFAAAPARGTAASPREL